MEEQIFEYSDFAIQFILENGVRLAGGIAVLILGFWVIRLIKKAVVKLMEKRQFDPTLQPFLRSLIVNMLKALLIVSVLSMIGIEMTSFVAILGAAGLAVGLALSGTLQNFAGGVMILLLKPFKVGDFIEAQGYTGTVKEIQIFNTTLTTTDNKRVIIPNGGLSTSSMINYTAEATRRVDIVFGIAYGDDVEKAKKIIRTFIEADERILKEPEPFVRLGELADSSVNIITRSWTKTEDYWAVRFDLMEKVYAGFNAEGINIPFPQMDVHVRQAN